MIDETHGDNDGWSWRYRWVDESRDRGVVVWDDDFHEVQLWDRSCVSWRHRFDPTATDCGPLEAYCRGDMPAHVFADWVEENAPDFPAEGLAILRADLG